MSITAAAGEPPLVTYVEKLSHRMQALAPHLRSSHGRQLCRSEHCGPPRHIDPFSQSPERLRLTGPAFLVDAAAAQSIGLALPEVVTNSARHGRSR